MTVTRRYLILGVDYNGNPVEIEGFSDGGAVARIHLPVAVGGQTVFGIELSPEMIRRLYQELNKEDLT